MCSKDLDEQYTPDIAFFLYCIFLHFNVSFVRAAHFVYLVWCIRSKCH